MIEDQNRADLADRGGAETGVARGREQRRLVEEIAAIVLIDAAQHRVVFERRRHAGIADVVAGINGVAEDAGIADPMAGRHGRGVRHGEGREHRMAVLEIDALIADCGHGRRGLRRHHLGAHAIGHEENDIVRPIYRIGLRNAECRDRRERDVPVSHGSSSVRGP